MTPKPGQNGSDDLLESIEQTPIPTVITNPRLPNNPIVAANRAFCELTGYSSEEVLGKNCRFLAGPSSDPRAQALLRAAVTEQRSALTEVVNYRKDGTAFRNAVMIAPVLGEDGTVAYFIGSQMEVGPSQLATTRGARALELVRTLTPRQKQVLEHMIQGLRNKQIAALLGIDEKTVKMHRAGLLKKLSAASSAEAIRIGVEAGLQLSDRG